MVIDAGPKNAANEHTPRSEYGRVCKNNLTEPTLLEMSDDLTNQELASVFKLASRNLSVIHDASEYALDTTSGTV